MVTDPKKMVASNCPWPLVKKKEIIYEYSQGPKKKKKKKNTIKDNTISIKTGIIIVCNLYGLYSMFFLMELFKF